MSQDLSASIYHEYLQLTHENREKHGSNAIVLLQVGAFFEVYGFKCPRTGDVQDKTPILAFSQICNLNVSEKKIVYDGQSVVMAGFRDYNLDRYLQKITDSGYTVAVYVQEKKGNKVIRVFDAVYSSGTYVSYETDNLPQTTNHIMCIWLELHKPVSTKNAKMSKTRDTMVCGVAVANIFTGRSTLTEYVHSWTLDPTTFDELEKIMAIYQPSELLCISNFSEDQINKVLQFSGVQTSVVHRIPLSSTKAERCTQQKYIQHILDTFYDIDAYNTYEEFTRHPTATQAFCFLLDFVQDHNPKLVRNIQVPDFQSSETVLLANHTLKQLNILDTQDTTKGRLSSVSAFLNKCCSPMGKRMFHGQLVAPTTNVAWINQEYEMTKILLNPDYYEMTGSLRKILGQVRDIEKMCRQLVLRKIYPSSIYHLYASVQSAQQIQLCFAELPSLLEYLGKDVQEKAQRLLQFFESKFLLDKCRTCSSTTVFEENILSSHVCKILDQTLFEYQKNTELLLQLHRVLNDMIRDHEGGNENIEYVKIHETEKSGMCFHITKKRGAVLKKMIAQMGDKSKTRQIIYEMEGTSWNQITLKSASSSADEIEFPMLKQLCSVLLTQKEELNKCICNAYHQVLQELETNYYDDLEEIAMFLSKVDVLQTKAFIAQTYHYCCPKIVEESPKAFVHAQYLRHPLIEHIQTHEIYVANTMELGKQTNGVLLYGTNAVGKTSFIRALGISIIMAQAGLYVPCTQFEYKPYTAIFSRILGNDNLFKGLSTFAVEMSELRVILKMADENSLVLGDELCSGTETESALSIFTAGLMYLHEKGSSFLFATHFHEIVRYEEIQSMEKLALKHMAVHYDAELDALVYDRKIVDGPGNRMYGLEVCKSLHLPQDFLDMSYQIRRRNFPDSKSELMHGSTKYNAKKIRGFCEICQEELGEEIHHLEPQQLAQNGFIHNETGVFHKNHLANLVSVCEKCHQKAHHTTDPFDMESSVKWTKKKTTRGYKKIPV